MTTLDLLPGKADIADALRQLTGRNNSPGHLLTGIGWFAAGLLAGAALAALLAPRSGADLRQQIGTRVGDLRDKIGKPAEGAVDSSTLA